MVALVQVIGWLAVPAPVITIPGYSVYAYGLHFRPPEGRIIPRHARPISNDQKFMPGGMNHNGLPIMLAADRDFGVIDISGLGKSLPWRIGHKYPKLAARGVIGNLGQGLSQCCVGFA